MTEKKRKIDEGVYDILNPVVIAYSTKEVEQYSFIPSVKYRREIEIICRELKKIKDIQYFYLQVTSSFTKPLCLGNIPNWSITYNRFGLSRLDVGLMPPENAAHVLTEEYVTDELNRLFYRWFEAYGIFEAYSIVRHSEDVKIIAIAHSDRPIQNQKILFENTIDDFENFTIQYIDYLLPAITEAQPALALTDFFSDPNYRAGIIKKRSAFSHPILSEREKQVLLCAFRGLSAKETARYLQLEHRTIEKYINNARKKLDAKNTTHAVKKAVDYGIITERK